ncbi:MAG: hypothetical protein E7384_07335 [Ruminococcaceae bacterium]|nr:hypothetical protein [Oscillospiraceae bacterium]
MERDEILKKAGKSKFTDEREYGILIQSYQLVGVSFFVIMLFFTIIEFLYFNKSFITSALFLTYFFCTSVSSWYRALRIKRRKLLFIEAIIATIAFIILIILFVMNVHHTFEIKGGYI